MKVFFLELNEFNEELLRKTGEVFSLPNVNRLVGLNQTKTHTDDVYESDFLEPWVQWVSVHTGKPSSVHQIKHLGDVPHLDTPQIWESLSSQGISSGVWGAMNASRGSAELCRFFLPDPWTASEKAYPEGLNRLLDPVRFASKNYLESVAGKVLGHISGLVRLIIENKLGWEIVKELPFLLKQAIRFKGANFVFIAFAEYLSTRLFLRFRKRHNPDFSLLFINTLAHLQHHYWRGFSYEKNRKLELGLKYLDRMLGHIFASLEPNEIFIAANALSQKNTNEEAPWILYRPLNHGKFLQQAGIQPTKIEPLMTHDAHLFFNTQAECLKAAHALTNAQIEGRKLFLVETYPEAPEKLFYRIDFTDQVASNAQVVIQGQSLPFFEYYRAIVERTGKHIQQGTVFSTVAMYPSQIMNHEILAPFFCAQRAQNPKDGCLAGS